MYDADRQTARIAESLRRICEGKDVTLSRLAKMTGISKSTLSKIMKGEASPFLHTIFRICNALDISLEELIGEESQGDELRENEHQSDELRRYGLPGDGSWGDHTRGEEQWGDGPRRGEPRGDGPRSGESGEEVRSEVRLSGMKLGEEEIRLLHLYRNLCGEKREWLLEAIRLLEESKGDA